MRLFCVVGLIFLWVTCTFSFTGCKPMHEYLPPAVERSYDMKKHNGTWYEVSFRDLYPWGPVCFCQQSIKYVNPAKGFIDDYFVFTCGLGVPNRAKW